MNKHNPDTMDSLIWVPDKDYEWILGEITETRGDNIRVSLTQTSRNVAISGNLSSFASTIHETPFFMSGFNISSTFDINAIFDIIPAQQVVLNKRQSCRFDVSHLENLDDLKDVKYIHDGPILHILRRRWVKGNIYTNIGDVLMLINPYRVLNDLHSDFFKNYSGDAVTSCDIPHVYSIADRALKNITINPTDDILGFSIPLKNQSIVLSGESGSGKSEASRNIISFLSQLNEKLKIDGSEYIKDGLLDSCFILEAFGNATTPINSNSSRFGKFIKLKYSPDNDLSSASIETFMLEKNRLTNVSKGERNFHIFYQLLRGIEKLNPSAKSSLALSSVDDYRLLTTGDVSYRSTDASDLSDLYDALLSIGCTEDDVSKLWAIISVILHLGNINFHHGDSIDAPLHISTPTSSVHHISKLLGVTDEDLKRVLISRSIQIRPGEPARTKFHSVMDAIDNISRMIKSIYQSVFSWLLQCINKYHESLLIGETSETSLKYVGILDTFGFESLEVNSLDQLFINLTSERIHEHYNEYTFDNPQEIYVQNDLNWSPIYYQDNNPVIDVLSKKPVGILNVLEEHMLQSRNIDELTLIHQYHQLHGNNPDRVYIKPKFGSDPSFTIRHYPGLVTYQIDNFFEKNIDSASNEVRDLLQLSSNEFLIRLIASTGSEGLSDSVIEKPGVMSSPKPISKKASIFSPLSDKIATSSIVRHQLDSLIASLNSTDVHYIKCIRPNDSKSPSIFQSSLVKKQLRDEDISDLTKLQKLKFYRQYKFTQFYQRYDILLRASSPIRKNAKLCKLEADAIKFCRAITDKYLTKDQCSYGRSLVFIRKEGHDHLERITVDYIHRRAVKVQALIRMFLAFTAYQKYQASERKKKAALKQAQEASREEERRHHQLQLQEAEAEIEHATKILSSLSTFNEDDDYEDHMQGSDDISGEQIAAQRGRERAKKYQKRETIRRHGRLVRDEEEVDNQESESLTTDSTQPPSDDDYRPSGVRTADFQTKEVSREESLRRKSPARLDEEKKIRKEVEQRRQEDIKRRAERKRNLFEEEILRRRIAEETSRLQASDKIRNVVTSSERSRSNPHSSKASEKPTRNVSPAKSAYVETTASAPAKSKEKEYRQMFEEQRRRSKSASRVEKKASNWSIFTTQTMDDVFVPPNEWTQPVGAWLSGLWGQK